MSEPTYEQLLAENSKLKAEVVTLGGRAIKICRWILTERSKLIIGKTQDDHREDEKMPLPVTLWRFAQELTDDRTARLMAHNLDNAQRKRKGLPERPESDDFWLRQPV